MTASATPAVELRGLTKTFGTCTANSDIHVRVMPGTVHAIIGENGAGKSTAMKMLYGIYQPDCGEIRVRGQSRKWKSPADAIEAGIGMVHQHFMLADPYDAVENILVGAEPKAGKIWSWLPRFARPLNRQAGLNELERLSVQYGLPVNWNARVEDLPVGVQQRIEILKLLYRKAEILILDEPTAVLTPQETSELFSQLKKLCAEGKTILIITHKLKEVMAIADRVTVFRANRVVGEVDRAKTSIEELASLMVGRKVQLQAEAPKATSLGSAVLKVSKVSTEAASSTSTEKLLQALSFEVRAGEVVGIAGVEGNGQSELLQLLMHPKEFAKRSEGRLEILGSDVLGDGVACHTSEIKARGVGFIPEDRHKEGLMLDEPLRENFLLGLHQFKPFRSGILLNRQALTQRATAAIEKYDVRPRALEPVARALSGGNQQKLIIAREFEIDPKFLIAAQPTRGVDVGAIEFIHGKILEARSQGTGVLLVSSELDEILALSDRILVMYDGRIVREFKRGEASEQELGLYMGGGKAQA